MFVYGEVGRVGHVDFCVNGGKRQPYCSSTSSKFIVPLFYILNYIPCYWFSLLFFFMSVMFFILCDTNQFQMRICAVTFGRCAIYRKVSMIVRSWMLNHAHDDVPLDFVVFVTIGFCTDKPLDLIFQWVNILQWSKFHHRRMFLLLLLLYFSYRFILKMVCSEFWLKTYSFVCVYSAYGSYCLKDNGIPFCPSESNPIGDHRCCIGTQQSALEEINYRSSNSIETMVDLVKARDKS